MKERLAGKVAMITGAGTGLGEAVAQQLAREGAKVFLTGLIDEPVGHVNDAIREHGGISEFCKGDISRPQIAEEAARHCIRYFGKLDILVNTTRAFTFSGETQDYPPERFDETIHMNIASVFHMTRAALPHLRQTRGTVLCSGSEACASGLAYNTVYGAAKGWIHSFVRGLAAEQAKHGIRANCICAGLLDIELADQTSESMADRADHILYPSRNRDRHATVDDIARVYAFLASDEARHVTGALWPVDGTEWPQSKISLPVHHRQGHKEYLSRQ